jgi:hypothetical protein
VEERKQEASSKEEGRKSREMEAEEAGSKETSVRA